MPWIITAHWLDRDDKTYFYGPFHGENQCYTGFMYLYNLWKNRIDTGDVGLYKFPLGHPPWERDKVLPHPIPRDEYYVTINGLDEESPWLKPAEPGVYVTQGFPRDCKDRPVKGNPKCILDAGHREPHLDINEVEV